MKKVETDFGRFIVVENESQLQEGEEKLGLYYLKNGKNIFVSAIVPELKAVYRVISNNGKSILQRYELRLYRPNGTDYGTRVISNLRKIDYFEVFGCPDGLITKKERKYHLQKLQEETLRVPQKTLFENCFGLMDLFGQKYILLGNEIISSTSDMKISVGKSLYKMRYKPDFSKKNLPYYIKGNLQKYLTLFPGVTEILFYVSLHAITKLFLVEMNEEAGFLTMLVGPPGHLKTSLVKKYALWTDDIQNQSATFQDYKKNSELWKIITSYAGNNFLADDIHTISSYYGKQKQENRLDEFARLASSNTSCANIIVTGESVLEMGIFSCLDRILQIKIPAMTSEELRAKKVELSNLDPDFMPEVARYYAIELMKHYDEVCKDIEGFITINKKIAYKHADGTLRTAYHMMYIQLTEFLFRKYCCENSTDLSGKEDFEKALEYNRCEQESELQSIRDVNEHDYVLDLEIILNNLAYKDRFIHCVVDEKSYNCRDDSQCLYKNSCWYLTKAAMVKSLSSYLGKMVQFKSVEAQLKESGVLERGTKALTKREKTKEHYVICSKMLKHYCESKNGGVSMVVPVIR